MRSDIFLFSILFFIISCSLPCPKDKKLGTLNFSSETKSFLPVSQQVNEMVFENQKGEVLYFTLIDPKWDERSKLPVETLCERGGYLDKSTQVAYYDAERALLSYVNGSLQNHNYTLNIHMRFNNPTYGKKEDTSFFETLYVGGQKLKQPTTSGGFTLITNERGNNSRIPSHFRDFPSRFISDTVVSSFKLSNVYVNLGNDGNMKIYYSKSKGIEAFQTPNETWKRTK